MSIYLSLLYVAFLISFAQCQTTLSQGEISKILQMIQSNQPGGQNPQTNNADTVQLIRKLMASSQTGNQVPQMSSQPQAPMNSQPTSNTQNNLLLPLAVSGAIDNPLTALAATSMVGNNQGGGGGSGPNLSGYLTARAFDFNDMATNMMLFNGLNGQQQQPQPQQRPQQPQQPLPTTQPPQPSGPMQPRRNNNNGGLFGQSPMGNYFAARAFDFPDMYTNMMLFNGVNGNNRQQPQQGTNNSPPGSQQQTQNQAQSTFDPALLYLSAF